MERRKTRRCVRMAKTTMRGCRFRLEYPLDPRRDRVGRCKDVCADVGCWFLLERGRCIERNVLVLNGALSGCERTLADPIAEQRWAVKLSILFLLHSVFK